MPVATATVTSTAGPIQLDDGNPNGWNTTPGTPGAFFGATPVPQPASQGVNYGVVGSVTVAAVTCTPTSVAPNTTHEQAFAVTGAATGQVALAQKPTTDAGISLVGVRASASGSVAIQFANDTAATITPTAAETYTFELFPSSMVISATLTPAAVGPNLFTEQSFNVGGIAGGSVLIVNKPTAQAGLGITNARVIAPGVVGITFGNFTAATITPTAGEVYRFVATPSVAIAPVFKTLAALLTPVSVAANTTAEQTFTVAGIPNGSQVQVSKPTATLGLGIGNARVSAANSLVINYINNTSSAITPPAEVYTIMVFPAAAPAAGSVTTYNAMSGGTISDHAALVSLGLVAGP